MRSPGIGTVLHWRLPDVQIFDTDPSLVQTQGTTIREIKGLFNTITKLNLEEVAKDKI